MLKETRHVPARPTSHMFDPFDRSDREARTERNVRIPNDTPDDFRQEQRDIRACFRQNRYGK